MFPNNIDFFVEERLKERYIEGEQHRLSKQASSQSTGRIKLVLATAVGWLSRLRQRSSEPLQVHPVQQPIQDTE